MGKQALWGIIGGMFCTPCLFPLLYHELRGHTGRRKRAVPLPGHRQAAIESLVKLNKKNFIAEIGRFHWYQVLIFSKVNFQKWPFPVCFYPLKGWKWVFELSPVTMETAHSFPYSVVVFDMRLFHERRYRQCKGTS